MSNLRFWGAVALGTVAVVVVLFGFARYRASRPAPSAAPKIELQRLAEAPSPAPPVEISGIRLYYDAQDRPQVRAVIVNHSDEILTGGTSFRVALRPSDANPSSPPLAYFTFKLAGPLQAGDSREIRAPLDALATLAAMPAWNRLRVDIE